MNIAVKRSQRQGSGGGYGSRELFLLFKTGYPPVYLFAVGNDPLRGRLIMQKHHLPPQLLLCSRQQKHCTFTEGIWDTPNGIWVHLEGKTGSICVFNLAFCTKQCNLEIHLLRHMQITSRFLMAIQRSILSEYHRQLARYLCGVSQVSALEAAKLGASFLFNEKFNEIFYLMKNFKHMQKQRGYNTPPYTHHPDSTIIQITLHLFHLSTFLLKHF